MSWIAGIQMKDWVKGRLAWLNRQISKTPVLIVGLLGAVGLSAWRGRELLENAGEFNEAVGRAWIGLESTLLVAGVLSLVISNGKEGAKKVEANIDFVEQQVFRLWVVRQPLWSSTAVRASSRLGQRQIAGQRLHHGRSCSSRGATPVLDAVGNNRLSRRELAARLTCDYVRVQARFL